MYRLCHFGHPPFHPWPHLDQTPILPHHPALPEPLSHLPPTPLHPPPTFFASAQSPTSTHLAVNAPLCLPPLLMAHQRKAAITPTRPTHPFATCPYPTHPPKHVLHVSTPSSPFSWCPTSPPFHFAISTSCLNHRRRAHGATRSPSRGSVRVGTCQTPLPQRKAAPTSPRNTLQRPRPLQVRSRSMRENRHAEIPPIAKILIWPVVFGMAAKRILPWPPLAYATMR